MDWPAGALQISTTDTGHGQLNLRLACEGMKGISTSLDQSMCHIFDEEGCDKPIIDPIIGHLQASREIRYRDNPDNENVAERWRRRRERIEQLEHAI